MGYRRLGKTDAFISEISLGGHGGKSFEDRMPVLETAAELGVNYLDTNIVEEVAMYGRAFKELGRGIQERFHIGVASWPEKLTSEYEAELSRERFAREIDNRLKAYGVEQLSLWRPVGATWGEGQLKQETMYEVSPRVLDMVVEAFEKAHAQGKLRWLGISAHNPKVFRRVLNEYPQFSVILFPYMFLTKPYQGDSLLALARQKDVGVIAIKPFAAGTIFAQKPAMITGNLDTRASILLRRMLQEQRVSAIIPGVNTPEQLAENVKASHERDTPLDEKEQQALRECTGNFHAHLTPEYRWLHRWEMV
jgi:predicted aldo/keto reductase-like oxidoreductase